MQRRKFNRVLGSTFGSMLLFGREIWAGPLNAGVPGGKSTVRINLTSVLVDDQNKALKFYTEVLGFVKKRDVPAGEARWLTVVSPETEDIELLLEPTAFPPAKTYQEALFKAGIPLASFAVDEIQKEYERMKELGVAFKMEPTKAGPAFIAILNDTCGNWIQLHQV